MYIIKVGTTSPTGGGRSVGIVRSRTKATEFSLVYNDSSVYLMQRAILIASNGLIEECDKDGCGSVDATAFCLKIIRR